MAKTYMSIDARKIIEKHEVEKKYYFDVEKSLKKSFTAPILRTAKKSGIRAALAMAQNGVFGKNIEDRVTSSFSEKESKVYNLICTMFIEADFNYSDWEAISVIAENYSLTDIYTTMGICNVKSAWYLNKVLQNTTTNSEHILVNEIDLDGSKGGKVDIGFMDNYV